jgi:hypothetical protein
MGSDFSNATSHAWRVSKTKIEAPPDHRCAPGKKQASKRVLSSARWPSDDPKPGLAVQMGFLWLQPAGVPAAASRLRLIG